MLACFYLLALKLNNYKFKTNPEYLTIVFIGIKYKLRALIFYSSAFTIQGTI